MVRLPAADPERGATGKLFAWENLRQTLEFLSTHPTNPTLLIFLGPAMSAKCGSRPKYDARITLVSLRLPITKIT